MVHLIHNKIEHVILSHNIIKEVIIVDHCSTDNTLEVIKNYISTHIDLSIEQLQHPQNKGK
jgi:glycosyltransferase involved in cell wall biosynthesis